MRRLASIVLLSLVAFGCSREQPVVELKAEPCAAVRTTIGYIARLEGLSDGSSAATGRVVNVKGMSARDFKRVLEGFPGEEVHVWMPGERDWFLVGRPAADRVSLADAMDGFAADTNCTMSVAELFASYAGTRTDILPAFESRLKGEVVPEWFVTKEIPSLGWLDVSEIDEDILKGVRSEIRSCQVVRREILKGNMLAAKATDKKGEDAATEVWARAALRNPHDPLLLERIENLNRNAKGFLAVGKVLPAMKCYETVMMIRPNDAVAVHNFGVCLKKIGKLDLAKVALERAKELSRRPEQ